MKKVMMLGVALLVAITLANAGINYDGSKIEENDEFTRTQCGTAYSSVLKEVSGLACSRETPGYLWAHGDENTGNQKKIIAIRPDGTLAMTVKISGDPGRDDWEDIATGVYDGTNYVFIGAFGDNNLEYKDTYYIYYFAEPAITSGTQTVQVHSIRFGFPDQKAHNTETLMYDNREQIFYIADKVKKDVCHLYSLPFQTTYGSQVQRLTEVCALGNGNKFNFVTGGDISPDGMWMLIKSKPYALLWKREGNESLSQTVQRHPTQIAAYIEEAQGEAVAWLDANTFYTTSDQEEDVPIFQYTRVGNSGGEEEPIDDPTDLLSVQTARSDAEAGRKILREGQVWIMVNGEWLTGAFDILGHRLTTCRH